MRIKRRRFILSAAGAGLGLAFHSTLSAAEKLAPSTAPIEETEWPAIKEFLFEGRTVIENDPITKIVAPFRAQNGADVSIKVAGAFPQTAQRHIKKHYMVVDKNPSPVVGQFDLSPQNGVADIATRIRIDQSAYVRVISETQDDKLYMSKVFVKSSGGCSAPPVSDIETAALTMGKTRIIEEQVQNDLRKIYLSIMHPNTTGLQRDIVTNLTIPPHYVTSVLVANKQGKTVLAISGDISFSENPSFEFYYKPEKSDLLLAKITDSQGRTYVSTRLDINQS